MQSAAAGMEPGYMLLCIVCTVQQILAQLVVVHKQNEYELLFSEK